MPAAEGSAFDLFEGLLGQVTSSGDGQEDEDSQIPASSAADLFAGRIGRIKGSTEAYSQNCGQRFAEYVAEKHEAGNL